MKRVCSICHHTVPSVGYAKHYDTCRQAKRGNLYQGDWPRRSREQRQAVPFCEECGTTTDLTADHLNPADRSSPLRTLCRRCNTSRANRARRVAP